MSNLQTLKQTIQKNVEVAFSQQSEERFDPFDQDIESLPLMLSDSIPFVLESIHQGKPTVLFDDVAVTENHKIKMRDFTNFYSALNHKFHMKNLTSESEDGVKISLKALLKTIIEEKDLFPMMVLLNAEFKNKLNQLLNLNITPTNANDYQAIVLEKLDLIMPELTSVFGANALFFEVTKNNFFLGVNADEAQSMRFSYFLILRISVQEGQFVDLDAVIYAIENIQNTFTKTRNVGLMAYIEEINGCLTEILDNERKYEFHNREFYLSQLPSEFLFLETENGDGGYIMTDLLEKIKFK